jgi:hypothetical protein
VNDDLLVNSKKQESSAENPVPRSTQLDKEQIAASSPESQAAGVLVVRTHQLLVRLSRWLNVRRL